MVCTEDSRRLGVLVASEPVEKTATDKIHTYTDNEGPLA